MTAIAVTDHVRGRYILREYGYPKRIAERVEDDRDISDVEEFDTLHELSDEIRDVFNASIACGLDEHEGTDVEARIHPKTTLITIYNREYIEWACEMGPVLHSIYPYEPDRSATVHLSNMLMCSACNHLFWPNSERRCSHCAHPQEAARAARFELAKYADTSTGTNTDRVLPPRVS